MTIPFSHPQDDQRLVLTGERATVLLQGGVLSVFQNDQLEGPPIIALRLLSGVGLAGEVLNAQDTLKTADQSA